EKEVGVSNPPVSGGRGTAGDDLFQEFTVETGRPLQPGTGLSAGEDEELTVMRILWDLYDKDGFSDDVVNSRAMDRVSLGYKKLYTVIAGSAPGARPQITHALTLSDLWHNLMQDSTRANGTLDVRKLINYGAVFQLNNVSARPGALVGENGPIRVWNAGDQRPDYFTFRIPTGSTGGGFPTTRRTLDSFRIIVFDSNYRIVLSTALSAPRLTVDGDSAGWVPSQAQWDQISAVAGVKHWIIVGMANAPGMLTGPYWSDEASFQVNR